ncbi:MAG: cupin domain-containing protein [Chlamydiia bacterium]|nr:cupin domain-containing protein [Chlamydiia bacterium]
MSLEPLSIADSCIAEQIDDDLIIYPFLPPEAAQGWKVELFELSRSIPSHYHKIQRQILLVAEGKLSVSIGSEEVVTLGSGELIMVDPGNRHSLQPKGVARFFDISFPGIPFPEDVFEDTPKERYEWVNSRDKVFDELDSKYFGARLDLEGYSAYELGSSEQKWSLALLEIQDSPKHFHQIEREVFIVAEGLLDIKIDNKPKLLGVGESIAVFPHQIHQPKSASDTPARVLCFNFPAFDPKDMHIIL